MGRAETGDCVSSADCASALVDGELHSGKIPNRGNNRLYAGFHRYHRHIAPGLAGTIPQFDAETGEVTKHEIFGLECQESTMAMQVYPIVPAVFFLFLSVLFTLGVNGRVFADNDCIEQPDRESGQGRHWYYHFDREKNRKCWHLEAIAPRARDAVPPQADRKETVATSTIGSAFLSLFRGLRRVFGRSMPHEAVAGEPRIIQSDATRPLTIEDIAQQQPDIPEERAEQRYVTPLTPAQRRALFEEYLKWEELQRNIGNSGAPPRSP